jgi:outer membrane protein OmpA-like peptidoglycan-associated protein
MKNSTLSRRIIFLFLVGTSFQFVARTASAQRDVTLISSRNYFGIEIGATDSWLSGASNFFWTYNYPYLNNPSIPVLGQLPFTSLGSGVGFHIAATLDLSFTDFWGLQAKLFYRTNHLGSTEQRIDNTVSSAPVTFEDNYSLNMGFFGLSAAARLQFIPKSFYGTVGLEYAAMVTNSFSGYEKIVSSTSGYTFTTKPGNQPTQSTEILVPTQKLSNLNSSQLALKLGIGTFIGLGGTNHWVLAPELNIGIPLSTLFESQYVNDYKNGYPSNNPNNPNFAAATPPKLWYISLSIALKFPFGAVTKAQQMNSSDEESEAPKNEPGIAHLKGKVTDAKTGKPLPAKLTVTDLDDNQPVAESKTDDDGDYDIPVKAPGNYSVTADADDHLFGSDHDVVSPDGKVAPGKHDIKLPEAAGRTKLLLFFDPGKTELKRSSYPELDRIVHVMQANPNMEVEIAGYTDSEGDDSRNLELSRRRAEAVKEYLVKKGIAENRVSTKGYGKANPIAPNDTEEGRAENRRVEFVVVKT